MFASKALAYPRQESMALLANIRLGWTVFPGANTNLFGKLVIKTKVFEHRNLGPMLQKLFSP
jgi:hypothetical protein